MLSFTALSSWAAFTTTVRAVSQSLVVNVSASPLRPVPDRVRAVPPWPLMVTVTVLVGWLPSFTV